MRNRTSNTTTTIHAPRRWAAALLLAAAAAATLAPRAGAQAAPAAAGLDPIVAPYVGPATLLVVRVDFTKMDAAAAAAWFNDKVLTKVPADQRADMATDSKQGIDEATRWLGEFKKAGGTRGFLVVSAAGASVPAAAGIFPIAPGANTAGLTNLFTTGHSDHGPIPSTDPAEAAMSSDPKGTVVGDTLVIALPGGAEKLKQLAGGDRPDLVASMASAGDAAVAAAISPPAALRAVGAAMLGPTLPPELGGGPTASVVNGFRWISLSIDPPPQTTGTLKVKAVNANLADAIAKTIGAAEDTGRKQAAEDKSAPDVGPAFDALAPKVAGDTVTIGLQTQTVDDVIAPLLATAASRARTQAKRVASMSNERQLLQACMLYANENKGALPPSLDTLKANFLNDSEVVFQNPDAAGGKGRYLYVERYAGMKMADVKNPSATVLVYEDPEQVADQINLGYVDGHVEGVPRDAALKQIEASKAGTATDAGPAAAPAGNGL